MSVIYEVTVSVDLEVIAEFDDWLAGHVLEMLEQPGFSGARVYEIEDDEHGRARRVTQYELKSQAHLDEYLNGAAAAMRQSGVERFGDRIQASRRVLSPSDIGTLPTGKMRTCLNCGATLGGQYCFNCGQRATSRMISIWELTRDAFGDLFEVDSRLWRTLIPLLVRPGKLTREYLEGRRARYMPPFRTYLVLSILFFMVAFFDPKEDFGFFFEEEPTSAAEQLQEEETTRATAKEHIIADLEKEGILVGRPDIQQRIQQELSGHNGGVGPEPDSKLPADEKDASGPTLSLDEDGTDGVCDTGNLEDADIPQWLKKRLSPERVNVMCNKILADDGESLFSKLLDNIPPGLILLLPLMALALKMLYPLSKRYYVEHLLFFVHFHAFLFLMLVLQITFARLAPSVSLPEAISSVTLVGGSLYIPIYLYKAMRRVYAQSHLLTIPKYLALIFVYAIGFMLMFVFALLLAAFSI